MRVFVTGGTGFAGSHLIDQLIDAGNQLFALSFDQFSHQQLPATVKSYPGDLMDLPRLHQILRDCQPEVIFHLAGLSSPPLSWQKPGVAIAVNSGGTANLLEAARRVGKPRVIIVTSADMYGRISADELPITEAMPATPRHPYGISKMAASLLAAIYWERYELPVVEARPFNHIGPRQALGFVAPDFASQIAGVKLGIQPPTMRVGNLDVCRDFCDVRDVGRAYIALAEKGAAGEAYLICSGQSVSIRAMLDMLIDIAGISVDVQVDPARMRPSDSPNLFGSFAKIEKDTGWRPRIGLRQSLEDVLIEWQTKLAT